MSTHVPLDRIRPNPANVRRDLGDVTELAASMKTHGVLQPLVVHPDGKGHFTIVDGHRRYVAASLAGLPAVPCVATRAADQGAQLEVMLAAAMHRGLEPVDQAAAFRALRNRGLSVADIARRTGYSSATISARLILGSLPSEAQDMVRAGSLTATEATEMAREVKRTGTGTARPPRRNQSRWFGSTHRLAATVQAACTHTADRPVVGQAGCGQCWEHAIRTDERARTAGAV